MKIFCLHNSYDAPTIEEQVFGHEIDQLRRHRHQVLLCQGTPAVETMTAGAER
jgi:hypothetical protein